MSKDFTPLELYRADKSLGGTLSGSKIEMSDREGNTHLIHDPNGELGKKYSNLYFLGGNVLDTCLEHGVNEEILFCVEESINNALGILDEVSDMDEVLSLVKDYEMSYMSVMWLFGMLDRAFYYRDRNDDAFINYIVKGEVVCEDLN